MSTSEWIDHLIMGREIEFHYKEEAFLIAYIPDTKPLQFSIWNGTKNCEVCRGNLELILNFEFEKGCCLKTSPEIFPIDYIL